MPATVRKSSKASRATPQVGPITELFMHARLGRVKANYRADADTEIYYQDGRYFVVNHKKDQILEFPPSSVIRAVRSPK